MPLAVCNAFFVAAATSNRDTPTKSQGQAGAATRSRSTSAIIHLPSFPDRYLGHSALVALTTCLLWQYVLCCLVLGTSNHIENTNKRGSKTTSINW